MYVPFVRDCTHVERCHVKLCEMFSHNSELGLELVRMMLEGDVKEWTPLHTSYASQAPPYFQNELMFVLNIALELLWSTTSMLQAIRALTWRAQVELFGRGE